MSTPERLFNLLFGLSALGWAVLGIALETPEARTSVPRLSVAALNAFVGALFILRAPLIRHGSPGRVLLALPSLALGGYAFSTAPSPETWPVHAQALLAAGLGWAILSFLFLGPSFAILPALRPVVTGGPYRLLRHPAYLGEFVAILGCGLAAAHPVGTWPVLAAPPFIVFRILAEEHLLGTDPAYVSYARTVRYRLVPGIW